jgi:uncharacterized protein (DUF433 family)
MKRETRGEPALLLAFSAEDVCRVTNLTARQLAYWDRVGFFAPEHGDPERRAFSRVYSFRDLVGLRTISKLLREGIPTSELRQLGKWLSERVGEWSEAPWANLTFYVGGKHLYFEDPALGVRRAGVPAEQTAMPVEMKKIVHEVRQEVSRLRERTEDEFGQVSQRRNVVHNAVVLAGTRIPTSAIWEFSHAGYDTKAIIREYPRLTSEDVKAAIRFEEERRLKKRAS